MIRIFGHNLSGLSVMLVAMDLVASGVIAAVLPVSHPATMDRGVAWLVGMFLFSASVLPVLGALGLYESQTWSRPRRILAGILLSTVAMTLVSDAIPWQLSAETSFEGWAWLDNLYRITIMIVASRLVTRALVHSGIALHRIAVIQGANDDPVLAAGRQGGSVSDDWFRIALVINSVADEQRITAEMKSRKVRALVASDPSILPPLLLGGCRRAGVRVFSGAEFREQRLSRIEVDRVPSKDTIVPASAPQTFLGAALQRGFDIAVSVAVLILTLPLCILAVIAIKLDSPGPVFYRQERVGLGGRTFSILKFRSMRNDAEKAGAPRWATVGDARVTRVGRWLRLTRIDEIPQVLNVLRGDMAFVGPRPERPAFVQQLRSQIEHYDERHCVKPGITGWAQVNMPYGASVDDAREKLAYDLYYARQRSLFLDLLILVATVRVVLFREGAR